MENIKFIPIRGTITCIEPIYRQCSQQFISLTTSQGIVNIIASPATYVTNQSHLHTGMEVTVFYDSTQPVPLIYPPQYQAVLIAPVSAEENVTLDYFDENLTAQDRSLQLKISPDTKILTSNGQDYFCTLENNILLVYYSFTTKSNPPQTTPYKVIVMC